LEKQARSFRPHQENVMGLTAIFLLAASILSVDDASAVLPDQFQAWFRESYEGRLRVPRAIEQNARAFRYVFVGGLYSERAGGYFSQCAAELRARGISRDEIHYIYPSSHKKLEENCDGVRDGFLKIADAGPERLVIIAHSRGACDALAFALRNPDFVRDRVEAIFLVQGPFGGSAAADYVMGEGKPLDGQVPPVHRALITVFSRFERTLMRRGKHAAIAELTTDASRAFWINELEEHSDAISIVGPKTFYIESQVKPSRLRLFQRSVARYLHAYYGPNDGVVALGDQVLPGLGTSLGVLDAGHKDLTGRFPSTKAGRRSRRALVQSILMIVGRADADSEPIPPRKLLTRRVSALRTD
jgi:pimeloyl-ACP methyl ester carboxylesterase